ncbi:MAG: sigma 54-interacting transcriptional regulator [Deltaproteobacteria bacterium]|nr:sigma 54-interacting transcriptional regulator [Deltaproteobacteria bacterium]
MSSDQREHLGPETVSLVTGTDRAAPGEVSDHLFVVIHGDRPLAPPARHPLEGIDEIELGRALATTEVTRTGRRLRLGFPDPRISTQHAVITRTSTGWVLADRDSKNGTFIGSGGRLTAPTPLAEATPFSIGHTFLMLRTACHASGPLVIDGAEALATLSPALGQRFHDLVRVAATGASIFIQGETGTGKERVARAIHAMTRRTGELVAVNCGALLPTLAASELFGHLRGAFSGATADRVGLVASAAGGTLFLDEVGDLPREVQPTLLRVLQEREVQALGANRPQAVDLRVVSASHRDLATAVSAGEFRADLHARLAAFTLIVPPMRERREDLGLILAELLRRHAPEPERITLSRGALLAIFAYDWPQNVRELESALTIAVALARDGVIHAEHLPVAVRGVRAPAAEPGATTGDEVPAPRATLPERRAAELTRLLARHGGNVAEVARELRRQRTLVHRWLRQYGIDPSQFRR